MKIGRHLRRKTTRGSRVRRQSGYMLLVILFMLAAMMIAATEVAPAIAQQIRRDREEELMHRGTQYARAIKRFYKKFGRYPSRLEELESSNNLRFLRKRYKDPITGKDEWRLIHVGEATITPKLFGLGTGVQPSPLTGAQPAAGAGASGALGSGASSIGSPAAGSQSGSQSTGPGGTPVSQMPGAGGQSGQTFGGGPIIGVSSLSEKESIKEMDGKNHYNQWEFVYDPRFDIQAQQGAQPGGGINRGPGSGPAFPTSLPGIGPQPPTTPPPGPK
jgi:type II secretory pathway pseudopilin PulG